MKKFEKLSLVKLHDDELKKVVGGAVEAAILLYGIRPRPLYGIVVKYGIQPKYGIRPRPLYGIQPLYGIKPIEVVSTDV